MALMIALVPLASCKKPPRDFTGTYKGHASLNKDGKEVSPSTGNLVGVVKQDGTQVKSTIAKSFFFRDCELTGKVTDTLGQVTGGSCALSQAVSSTGKAEELRVTNGTFYMGERSAADQRLEVTMHAEKGYAFEFRGDRVTP